MNQVQTIVHLCASWSRECLTDCEKFLVLWHCQSIHRLSIKRSIPSVHQPIPAYSHIYHGTVQSQHLVPTVRPHPSPLPSKPLQIFSCTKSALKSMQECDPYNLEMHWRPSKSREAQIPSLRHNIPGPLRSVCWAPSRSYRHDTLPESL